MGTQDEVFHTSETPKTEEATSDEAPLSASATPSSESVAEAAPKTDAGGQETPGAQVPSHQNRFSQPLLDQQEERVLFGTVLMFQTGDPISGAQITITGEETKLTRTMETNDQGTFDFGPMTRDIYVVDVVKDDLILNPLGTTSMMPMDRSFRSYVFYLGNKSDLTFNVTDKESGKPLEGVEIRYADTKNTLAKTNEEGRHTFHLIKGEFSFSLYKTGYQIVKFEQLQLQKIESALDVALEPAGRLVARVTDPDGNGLASYINIRGAGIYDHFPTNEDGSFTYEHLPFDVRCELNVHVNGGGFEYFDTEVQVSRDQPVLEKVFKMVPISYQTISVEGTVIGPDDLPISGALVSLSGGHSERLTADENGYWSIQDMQVANKSVHIRVHHPGFKYKDESINLNRKSPPYKFRTKLLPASEVYVLLKDEDGVPFNPKAGGLRVTVQSNEAGRSSSGVRLDENSGYTVPNVGLGDEIYFSSDHYQKTGFELKELDGGPYELVMKKLGTMVGKVVDSDGEPVTRFKVTLKSMDQPFGFSETQIPTRAFTADDGVFELTGVYPNRAYSLVIEAQGFPPLLLDNIVPDKKDQVFTLGDDHSTFRGLLLSPSGEPMVGIRVMGFQMDHEGDRLAEFWDPGRPPYRQLIQEVYSDENGQFKLGYSPGKSLTIISLHPGFARFSAVFSNRRLQEQEGEETFVLHTAAQIDIRVPSEDLQQHTITWSAGGARGRSMGPVGAGHSLKNLPAGTVEVNLSDRNNGLNKITSRTLELNAGETRELVLGDDLYDLNAQVFLAEEPVPAGRILLLTQMRSHNNREYVHLAGHAVVDGSGVALIPNLNPGVYQAHLMTHFSQEHFQRNKPRRGALEIEVVDQDLDLDLMFEPLTVLYGQVPDTRGLQLRFEGGSPISMIGEQFRVDRVQPGTHRLVLEGADRMRTLTPAFETRVGEELDLGMLDPWGDRALDIQFETDGTIPKGRVSIFLNRLDGERLAREEHVFNMGLRAGFSHLKPGRYRLSLSLTDGSFQSDRDVFEVDLTQQQTARLVIPLKPVTYLEITHYLRDKLVSVVMVHEDGEQVIIPAYAKGTFKWRGKPPGFYANGVFAAGLRPGTWQVTLGRESGTEKKLSVTLEKGALTQTRVKN